MQNTGVLELKWGTQVPIYYNDSEYGKIELKIIGICYYKVNTPDVPIEHLQQFLYNNIIFSVNDIIMKNQNNNYTIISDIINNSIKNTLITNLKNQDITIEKVEVSNVSLTEASMKNVEEIKRNKVTVVKTDEGSKDGQNKCPSCGSTDISLNVKNGKLRCAFCRCEFEPEKLDVLEGNVNELEGKMIGSGAQNIIADVNDVITFKCSSCGAEVVIDTAESQQARCHWCRSTLSINQQIPNGSIPDVVLPFSVRKEDARLEIEKFVKKRNFFANPKFKQEFTTNNIMGVYLPYMVVDINAQAYLAGEGEKLIRRYTRGSENNKRTYYDADLYQVKRMFDLTIEGLTVESSSDKLNKVSSEKTNNVINAIMPFDIENAVKWNANYLKGYSSEKRDTNIDELRPLVDMQAKDISRFAANETIKEYDRGVAWSNEQIAVKGDRWKAAYLPVWLYSYQQVKGDKKLLHYVAVNARTKETMGSVPIHMPKLILFSFFVEIFGIIAMLFADFDYNWIFLSLGFIFYFIMYARYRNNNQRHKHELETKKTMSNLRKDDKYITRRTGLSNPRIQGANNNKVNAGLNNQLFNKITNNSSVDNMINNNVDKGGN